MQLLCSIENIIIDVQKGKKINQAYSKVNLNLGDS